MNPSQLPLAEHEEMVLVRDAARALLQDQWPPNKAVACAADPHALSLIWKRAATLGWTALGIGGQEMGLAAALVLMQELGRASCPIPLLDAVLANEVLAVTEGQAAADLMKQLQAGDAVVTWVLGAANSDDETFEFLLGDGITGCAALVENTAVATHLLVVTGRSGEIAIVPRQAPGVSVTPTPGLNEPPLAAIRLNHVTQFELIKTGFDLATLAPLARLMLTARALGSARYGLEMLTEYAKVRSQFGKKIGQYQAVQHKLANCLISVEIVRLALLAAGRSNREERLYAAAVASANAGELLRKVALELHHGFGGISFWDEHELPRHFRRIHGDLTRLGGVQRARRDVAEYLLGRGATPEFRLSPPADSFRSDVREWLTQHWDGQYSAEAYALPVNHRKARQDFSRKLGAKGWLGITWPKAYGGQERSAMEHLAFEEEMAYAEAPVSFHNTAVNMIGPTLVSFASPEQKAHFLPGIARGEISIALGYSEPDYGSDLAGIRTSATRASDGGWRVNGQKIFTSTAGFSTHIWLAARTDKDQMRHGGISVFLLPLDIPGITIQPMSGLNGHRANIVFFDDVELSADALIGEENGGWKIITEALAYERVTLGAIGARARRNFDRLLAHLRVRTPESQLSGPDTLVMDRIGGLGAEVEAARLLAVNTAQSVEQGEVPLVQAGMLKVYASELMERLSEAAFDLLGAAATLKEDAQGALADGAFEYGIRDALLYTIGGGTNEIQRTLIALRGLDLPR